MFKSKSKAFCAILSHAFLQSDGIFKSILLRYTHITNDVIYMKGILTSGLFPESDESMTRINRKLRKDGTDGIPWHILYMLGIIAIMTQIINVFVDAYI